MPTKQQLSDEVNEKLDTKIDWSGLKKDELELFNELIDDGVLLETMAKHMMKEKGSSKYEKAVDDWTPGQIVTRLL